MHEARAFLLGLLQPMKYRIFLGAFLVAATVFGNVGLLATSGVLLTRAAFKPELLLLMPLITGVRFFGTARAALRYAERLFNHSLAFRLLTGLREDLYRRLEPLVPDCVQGYSEGKLYNRLIGDVEILKFFYLRVVSLPLGTALVILGVAGYTALFVPAAGAFLAGALLLSVIAVPLATVRRQIQIDHKRRQLRDALSNAFGDLVHGLFEWQTSAGGDDRQDRVDALAQADLHEQGRGIWTERLAIHGLEFVAHETALVVLLFTLPPVHQGELSPWVLPMLTLVAMASFETVNQMPQALRECWMSIEAAKDLAAIQPPADMPAEGERKPASWDIDIRNLSFNYHRADQAVLKSLNLAITYGRHVAFVGSSGSGKTSLARLLLRLWRPDTGEILIGGVPLDDIDETCLRQHIGYLEQTPSFFNTSLRDNLRLADPQANDAELWQVLKDVHLYDLVASWEDGLDTSILENGCRLSGGERQRLALARIILQNPSVVILDEPLHNLDGVTSRMLEEFLATWAQAKTVILISHDLKTLPLVDFICLFQYGKILASGSHVELIQHSAEYRDLWQLEQERI